MLLRRDAPSWRPGSKIAPWAGARSSWPASRLAQRLPTQEAKGRIAVLGALPGGARYARSSECVHVTIVAPRRGEAERIGQAAEVARPHYLVAELGKVSSGPSGRAAWRAGAVAIENFRRHWSIDDPEHALGDRRRMRSIELGAVGDATDTRLEIRQAFGSIERSPSYGRRGPGVPGLSR